MFHLIWFAIVNRWHNLFFITCRGKTPSNSNVSTRNLYWQIWTDWSHPWVDSTTNSRRAGWIHTVFIVAGLGACCVLQLPIVRVARGEEARRGCEDADAAPTAGQVQVVCTWIIFFRLILEIFSHFSNILPGWGQNCPDSSSFCPLSSSGQEKGCFGVGLGLFCVCTYPLKGCVAEE